MKLLGPGNERAFRSQSAMEYLMTYGWAILIIAVVLAALFELGVFNPMTFAPKASPGSCQVIRPEGAGTTNFISLEGECNGEIPQSVASFAGSSSDSFITGQLPVVAKGSYTVSAWVNLATVSAGNAGIFGFTPANQCGTLSVFPNGNCHIQVCINSDTSQQAVDSAACLTPNKWYFVVAWVNQNAQRFGIFINANSTLGANNTFGGNTIAANDIYIGLFQSQDAFFSGDISNVQLYNTVLSTNDVTALYDEGIGGAPIKIQSLVAWWPLNGNAQDYSGNGNNGVPTSVTYTTNWYSSYSAP